MQTLDLSSSSLFTTYVRVHQPSRAQTHRRGSCARTCRCAGASRVIIPKPSLFFLLIITWAVNVTLGRCSPVQSSLFPPFDPLLAIQSRSASSPASTASIASYTYHSVHIPVRARPPVDRLPSHLRKAPAAPPSRQTKACPRRCHPCSGVPGTTITRPCVRACVRASGRHHPPVTSQSATP